MEVSDEIVENAFIDWKKKEIHSVDKANLLESYRKHKGISQRELGRRLGISHSVIQDWLLFQKLDKEDYNVLKSQGHNQRDIYRLLRNNKKVSREEIVEITKTDVVLKKFIDELKSCRRKKDFTAATVWLIKQAKDELNHLEMYFDKENR